jgi:hypothetical protein
LSLCACEHAIAEPPVEVLLTHEIDAMAAEDARELFLDIEDAETDHLAGLEVDEDVNVAVWPEIVRQDGAKQGEFADVIPPAELSDSVAIDRDLGRHGSTHTTFRAQAGTSRILDVGHVELHRAALSNLPGFVKIGLASCLVEPLLRLVLGSLGEEGSLGTEA